MNELEKPESNILMVFERTAFFFFCIIVVDCTFSGFGHWLKFGNLSLRVLSGILSIIFSLPIFLKRWTNWIKNLNFVFILAFVLLLIYSLIIGILNKNSKHLILLDLRGFFWFGLLIVSYSVCNTDARIRVVLTCLLLGGLFQTIIINSINFVMLFIEQLKPSVFYMNEKYGLGIINHVGNGLFRIFFRSNLYLGIAFLIIFYNFLINKNDRLSKVSIFFVPMLMFSILFTFTRSTYFAVVISIVVFIVLMLKYKSESTKSIVLFVFLSIIISILYVTSIQTITKKNYLGFALQRTLPAVFNDTPLDFLVFGDAEYTKSNVGVKSDSNVGVKSDSNVGVKSDFENYISATVRSDDIRLITKEDLYTLIEKNPIKGNGLGAAIPSRETGINEYFFLDLFAKLGIFGVIFYFLPIIVILIRILTKSYTDQYLMIMLFAGLILFVVASYFNPYMNSVLGIVYYVFIISVDRHLHIKNNYIEDLT